MNVQVLGALALDRNADKRASRCPLVYVLQEKHPLVKGDDDNVVTTQSILMLTGGDYKPSLIPSRLGDLHKPLIDKTRAYNLCSLINSVNDDQRYSMLDNVARDVFNFIDYVNHCRQHNNSKPGAFDPSWISADNILGYRNTNEFDNQTPCLLVLDVTRGVPIFNHAAYSLEPSDDMVYSTIHPLNDKFSEDWSKLSEIQAAPRSSSTLVALFHPSDVEFRPTAVQLFPGKTVNDVAGLLNVAANYVVTKNYGSPTTRGSTDKRDTSIDPQSNILSVLTTKRG